MKDILTAPFVKEMCDTTANMYRLGWDERNGGNISYLLGESEVSEYLDLNNVIRTIPTGFDAPELIGKIFIVTGTGKYFKNVEKDPENNLGIIRIAKDGTTAELLWGYSDGGRFTSELPAHLMSHRARLKVDPENRVVMHSHCSIPRRCRCSSVDALRYKRNRRSNRRKNERIQACYLGYARYLRCRQNHGRNLRAYRNRGKSCANLYAHL